MRVPLIILCTIIGLLLCCSHGWCCFKVIMAAWVGGVAAVLYLTDDSKMVPKEGKTVLITGCDTGNTHKQFTIAKLPDNIIWTNKTDWLSCRLFVLRLIVLAVIYRMCYRFWPSPV